MTSFRTASRARRLFPAMTLTLALAGAAGAVATPAQSATTRSLCPAAEITAIWYGNDSSDSRCGHIPDYLDHLFYADPMLTTAARYTYSERAVVVQLRLRDLGYRPVTIDGKYGSQTSAAITRLQKNRGLYVDGKVGLQTWRSLFGLGRA